MQRPDGTATMSDDDEVREVAGSDDSLLVLIKRGEVPSPAPMAFNGWQKRRRDLGGKRPTERKDGVGPSPRFEAELWRSCMTEIYGDSNALKGKIRSRHHPFTLSSPRIYFFEFFFMSWYFRYLIYFIFCYIYFLF